jgi:thiol-disulfide isomerase/thioredoxin
MKKYFVFLFSTLLAGSVSAQGYQVTLKAPAFKSGIAYLTYYMGDNLNVADSAAVSNTGTAIFKGASKLPPGIYVAVLPGKRLRTEFLIDKEQQISIAIDTSDILNKTIITGSKENIPYMAYQKFVAAKGKLLQKEKQAYMMSLTKADSSMHETNYNNYNKQLNEYRNNVIKTQPNSMLAVLLNAMKEPVVPGTSPVTHQDSINNYYYYKNHYWDGISFMDARVIRTPFFPKKLERYYREIIPQAADSIIKDADYKILLARTSPEMYKYLLNWLTDEYINPKYMGQDAIFVHLFENYHSKGLTNWLNEKQMETISRRAYMLMANLIGEKGADLDMVDSTGKPSSLYNLEADYTVLVFWDPNCGHCKEEIPRIDSIYQASWKKHGVKIYAVLTQDEKEDLRNAWVNYIKEHHLGEWTHAYQTREMEAADRKSQVAGFRQLYDVTMTPTIYLLDKEKHIIGKKLTWEQLNDFLEVKWKTTTSH